MKIEEIEMVWPLGDNEVLLKVKEHWLFLRGALLSIDRKVGLIISSSGPARDIFSFFDNLRKTGLSIKDFLIGDPKLTFRIIDLLCRDFLRKMERKGGIDKKEYREYIDELKAIIDDLEKAKDLNIRQHKYLQSILDVLQKTIHKVSLRIFEA